MKNQATTKEREQLMGAILTMSIKLNQPVSQLVSPKEAAEFKAILHRKRMQPSREYHYPATQIKAEDTAYFDLVINTKPSKWVA